MIKLYKFTKDRTRSERLVVTSVNLERKQIDFIRKKRVNLSALVRSVIDSLIVDEEKQEKNKP